jgi:4-amino-4-deoxy-L-arabinose transferase-like glycosyltransferase
MGSFRSNGASPPRRFDARNQGYILVVALCALGLFLYGAGAMPLTDPDEGRYAEIAREMAGGGGWVVPTLFATPYLEKPPLLYWATAAAFRIFGAGEQAARAVPALAATCGVFAAGVFAAAYLTPLAGHFAAIVLGLSALYVVIARTMITDMLFAVLLAATLFSFFAFRDRPTVVRALGFWLLLAAATLSKGPAAIFLCGSILVVDAAIGRSWRTLFDRRLLALSFVYFAVALPWFVLVQLRYPSFFSFYVWKEHLGRAAGSEHAEPFYWFVPWLAAGLMPWTPLAIAAAPRWWATLRDRSSEARVGRFLLVWAITVFVVFSLMRGKLATYILPMFPPLAVLLGGFVDRCVGGGASRQTVGRAAAASGALFLVAAAAIAIGGRFFDAGIDPRASAIVVVSLIGGGLVTLLFRRAEPSAAFAALAASAAASYVALATVAPTIAQSFTARPLIDRVAREIGPDDAYALWGKYLPSAAFYLERLPYLVGTRPELRFGKSLVDEAPNIVVDLHELHRVTAGSRLYVFTDNREKRERELREVLGDVRRIDGNYAVVLWVRPGPESLQARIQGRNR